MDFKSSSVALHLILRVSIGLSMLLAGIAEYRDFAPFVASVTDGLGWMTFAGTVVAYLLPALLIFGGGLLALGRYSFIAAWTGGIALGLVPVGLLLKTTMTGLPLPDMITAGVPALVWLIAFYFALNLSCECDQ